MSNTFLKANWENLVMANYEVEPSTLTPYLPKGLELDFYNDKTYVSLVGFMFKKTSLFGVPIPFFGSFEEINLRFYVKRIEGKKIKKGVVFINETVPFKIVALLANKLYKEHYISIPTKNAIDIAEHKNIQYNWKMNEKWNSIIVQSDTIKYKIEPSSIEEFIFERYFGFTKLSPLSTQEYRIQHPKWSTNKILNHTIDCDFGPMYGNAFASLNNQAPNSIIMAEGSQVRVNWKRDKF
ncbi:MAG: DUF2071 domain-containing protein [Chlamydiota bacterium]